jgi:SAM-dependent methyltransferase
MTSTLACRFCGQALTRTFVDLGTTPLANSYLRPEDLARPEPSYPLHARVCDACLLVQVQAVVPAEEIFSDYAYFSSVSSSWVEHARRFAEGAARRLGLDGTSKVVEIASNDGYLLQHFVAMGVPVLGVEPAANVARVAIDKGVPTEVAFFGRATAERLLAAGHAADLVVANNVLAHVPDLNDFVAGLALLVKPTGLVSVEFPHLLNLIAERQFDTIYHEHYCYFSAGVVRRVFAAHGLELVDVERLATHGGSLRVLARRADGPVVAEGPGVADVLAREAVAGLDRIEGHLGFAAKVAETQEALRAWLAEAKAGGRKVAAYGAAAKGNTLLNSSGVGRDDIVCVADKSPHKQGLHLPGSRIPIVSPEALIAMRPDDVLILPWNLADEIAETLAPLHARGTRLMVPIPLPRVLGEERAP